MYIDSDRPDDDLIQEWEESHEVLNAVRIYAEMLIRFNAPWASDEYNKVCQDIGQQILNMIVGVADECK